MPRVGALKHLDDQVAPQNCISFVVVLPQPCPPDISLGLSGLVCSSAELLPTLHTRRDAAGVVSSLSISSLSISKVSRCRVSDIKYLDIKSIDIQSLAIQSLDIKCLDIACVVRFPHTCRHSGILSRGKLLRSPAGCTTLRTASVGARWKRSALTVPRPPPPKNIIKGGSKHFPGVVFGFALTTSYILGCTAVSRG